MLADVQAHFGFKRPLYGAGVFETDHQRTVVREVCSAVQTGRLVLLSGLVGSGKTHLLARIEDELTRAGRVAVSRSLAVPRKSLRDFAEKTRVTLSTLIEALFHDLGDKNVVIPKPPEKRERELRDLVRKARRPVVLIVDEAQDLHPRTLTGLKRLMEVACCPCCSQPIPSCASTCAGPTWSRSATVPPSSSMTGSPATSATTWPGFSPLAPRTGSRWPMSSTPTPSTCWPRSCVRRCRLRSSAPSGIEMHLELAFEAAYRAGAKPVPVEIVDGVLSRAIDDLEPRLIRNGYDAATLAREFGASAQTSGFAVPAEIRTFLAGTLGRTGPANSPTRCAPPACPCDGRPSSTRSVSQNRRRLRAPPLIRESHHVYPAGRRALRLEGQRILLPQLCL